MGHPQRGENIFDRAARMPHWRVVSEDICGNRHVSGWPYFERPYLRHEWEQGAMYNMTRPLYVLKVTPK